MARTRVYRNGILDAEDFPVAEVSDHLADPAATVWLDFCAPTEDDLAAISEELGLHELAVEGAVDTQERAKLECFRTHSFLSAYAVRMHAETGHLRTSEVAAFVTDRALVTVRKDEHFDIDAVLQRWDSATEGLAKSGVGFLLHGLLDYIVDGHFEAAQIMDEQIEDLEDLVFEGKPDHGSLQRRSLHLRKSLVRLRRAVVPMREVLSTVVRPDLGVVDEAMAPYFQDVEDHVLRAAEWTDSLRDLITTVRETQLNLQAHRLNTVMKKVTSWAAVIAVPTAITGFYGQNVPFPGDGQPWGFWVSATAIVLGCGVVYALFKKRDWL
ncbi:magnesium transporter CorA family protein [Saccharopolyspora phatthalungensis]|uniref:Magnesium transporter n=1 Tax=Saccharopolyspora phatthalungensis TaxID=664693 RepID=A0A840QEJ6_9PSEU|nr:magnesium transporter CorA family protein [Saccharopolyspora phatthalungensis]MBB5159234.1 magnesium transporter [Saccharopolyspora phatthalungensis]